MGQTVVLVGEYGSGKTEFALNLAAQKSAHGSVTVVDLDIVNPYFRSRTAKELMAGYKVKFVFPEALRDADLPVVTAGVDAAIGGPGLVLLDVGGDDGAVVLGRYRHRLEKAKASVWQVVNCNRPFTSTTAGVMEATRRIQDRSGLQISGLVNNTNLGPETTGDDVLRGDAITREVGELLAIPLVYHCARPHLLPGLAGYFGDKLLSMDISLFPEYFS